MHIERASTGAVSTEDAMLGMLSVALIVIEMGNMDGDVTALQGAIADLKKEVGTVACVDGSEGSLTISVTVLDGNKIVLMGMYRNPGVAYDEACAILARHGVNVDKVPELTGNPHGDDRYQPGTRNLLPPRVKKTVAAATDSASAE